MSYLFASLVRFSLMELGCELPARVTPSKPGFPVRRNIPAHRNQAAACD